MLGSPKFPGFQNLLNRAEQRLRALSGPEMLDAFEGAADELLFVYRRNIQNFTPGRVKDLSPEYKKRKRKLVGYAYPILFRTGIFVAAMYTRARAPTSGHVWRIVYGFTGTHPDTGIDLSELADIHIQGKGRNPARDFTNVPNEWKVSLLKRVKKLTGG